MRAPSNRRRQQWGSMNQRSGQMKDYVQNIAGNQQQYSNQQNVRGNWRNATPPAPPPGSNAVQQQTNRPNGNARLNAYGNNQNNRNQQYGRTSPLVNTQQNRNNTTPPAPSPAQQQFGQGMSPYLGWNTPTSPYGVPNMAWQLGGWNTGYGMQNNNAGQAPAPPPSNFGMSYGNPYGGYYGMASPYSPSYGYGMQQMNPWLAMSMYGW